MQPKRLKKQHIPTQEELEDQYLSISACKSGGWTICTWKKDGTGEVNKVPFQCRSWRHAGECRAFCGACDFARIALALKTQETWTYLVLTYPCVDWPNAKELYRFGVVSWSRLRKRLIYEYGDIKYIQTWERTQNGYPHVNCVVCCRNLWEGIRRDGIDTHRSRIQRMAMAVGFGKELDVSNLRSKEAMAGYIAKLALELTGASIKNQIPVNAPPHFRRIRASQGLLPKRVKDDTITGTLAMFPVDVVSGEGTKINTEIYRCNKMKSCQPETSPESS